MKISNPFRYQFRSPGNYKGSVLKVWFGKRYYILKAKSAIPSINGLAMELDRRLRLGAPEDHIYHLVVQYIRKARIVMMEVELLLESDDPLELLQCEHNSLADASYDKDCLNTSFAAYVPQWIPHHVVESFYRWKNPEPKKKRNASTKNNKAVPARGVGRSDSGVSNRGRRTAGAGSSSKDTRPI